MAETSVQLSNQPAQLVQEFLSKLDLTQLAVLTDENTKSHCYPLIKSHLPPHTLIEIPSGEAHKNIESCITIWKRLTELNFDRHSIVLVLGGGVLGDMGGFCAATYKRGIRFILMPTTLLAQVDASIGGKLGIDFDRYKNHIGVFQLPLATLVSPTFLKTLPERELRSGFAEVIKHCLIADKAMWEIIRKKSLAEQDWETLIPHSIKIKETITIQDPTEKGIRKILNFGHTLGHAFETYFLSTPSPIFHGEAVAMGMIMEAKIANAKGLLSLDELNQLKEYVLRIFGKVTDPFPQQEVIRLAIQDKKNKGEEILMAVPKGIGTCVWDEAVSEKEMIEAIEYYQFN
jgi:3-dehydroquinate synthase